MGEKCDLCQKSRLWALKVQTIGNATVDTYRGGPNACMCVFLRMFERYCRGKSYRNGWKTLFWSEIALVSAVNVDTWQCNVGLVCSKSNFMCAFASVDV